MLGNQVDLYQGVLNSFWGKFWLFVLYQGGSNNQTPNITKKFARLDEKYAGSMVILSIPFDFSWDKIWREKLSLCLVQIEIHLFALLSFCTKPRKSFSRQIFSRDGGGEQTKWNRQYYHAAGVFFVQPSKFFGYFWGLVIG